jgi:putative ABC transport system substrate-binding protein
MRRREFITLVGGAAAWPLMAHAQEAKSVRRIGVLMSRREADPEGLKQFAALRLGLRDLEWAVGQTLLIEVRWTEGSPAKAVQFATELTALKPDVLVANGTPSLGALRQTTSTIPIVFVGVADPVSQGFVPSLARPGGNITGFSVEEPSMGGKWLELLKEIAPRVNHAGVIFNPNTAPYAPMFTPTMQAAAQAKGVAITLSPVRAEPEIETAVAAAARAPNGGLIVLPDSFLFSLRESIVTATGKHRLPAIYPIGFFVNDGGLIAYGIDRVDLFRRAASYVDRILKGAAPAELAVQQPTKFELAVNLKTAKTLGLTVSQSLLLSADEVVE